MAGPGRALRADAERNRSCIIEAARAAYAERGVNVALEEIARRAGVGIATLYRRFRNREELISAAFTPNLRAYEAAARAAAAAEDAWEGFSGLVRGVCAMQAADAGFADVLVQAHPADAELNGRLRAVAILVEEVVRRARAQGALRPDFEMRDLELLVAANAGVVRATRATAPGAWERFASLMLDSFRVERTPAPPASGIRRPR